MKKLVAFLFLTVFSFSVFAVDITIAIPQEKIAEYVSDYVYIHSNTETIDNPEFISLEETPEIPEKIAKYTDAQWVKEHLRRYIIGQIKRGKKAKDRDAYENPNISDIE